MKKLFVGGLSWNTTDESLHAAFAGFGEVMEAKVIMERETGRSRGFGFVTFQDSEAATQAVDALNETELDGRRIAVNEARERSGGDGGRRDFGGRDGGSMRR